MVFIDIAEFYADKIQNNKTTDIADIEDFLGEYVSFFKVGGFPDSGKR